MLGAWLSSRDEEVAEPGCRSRSLTIKTRAYITRLPRIIHLTRRDGADSLGNLSRVTQGQSVEGRLGSESRSDLSPTLSATPTRAERGPGNNAGLQLTGSSLPETDTGQTGSVNTGNGQPDYTCCGLPSPALPHIPLCFRGPGAGPPTEDLPPAVPWSGLCYGSLLLRVTAQEEARSRGVASSSHPES